MASRRLERVTKRLGGRKRRLTPAALLAEEHRIGILRVNRESLDVVVERGLGWVQRRLDVDPLFETFPHLTAEHRATLGLARFLWQQIEAIQAANYAGPALLFTGVLEELIKATVFARSPQLYDHYGKELYRTLGVIGRTCKDRGRNWRLVTGAVFGGNYWKVQVTGSTKVPFEAWGLKVWDISRIRNQAAHEAHVSKDEFLDLERLYFGSLRDGFGALNGLLMAWRETGQG